jgi:hypothetical protein
MTKEQPSGYGDGPIDPKYREQMVAVMGALDEFVNPGRKGKERENAIVVMMFKFGTAPGRCNFMSNGVDRRDLIVLMKEMIARFEGQPEISGRA